MNLALLAAEASDEAAARGLAQQLDLPLLAPGCDPRKCESSQLLLVVNDGTLSLQQGGSPAPGPVSVDFGSGSMRHRRRSGSNELLGRAVGVGNKHGLRVLDATAGLGRDSFVLADSGCDVLLCEREPAVHALLQSGLDQATAATDEWLQGVVARMQLLAGDARDLLPVEIADVDVIYLDPMFPERGKSAAVKKEMSLLQGLLQAGNDADNARDLFNWAMQQSVARVVVKRPAKGGSLSGQNPSHCIRGKAVRYDVYVQHKLA